MKTAAEILAEIEGGEDARKPGRPRTISYQGDVCLDQDEDCGDVVGLGRCTYHYAQEVRRRKAAGEHVYRMRCPSVHPSGAQCERNAHKTLTRDDTKNQMRKSPHRNGPLRWMDEALI